MKFRSGLTALCLRREVLYMTSSGKRNGGDVASCCFNGPKILLLFVIEGR